MEEGSSKSAQPPLVDNVLQYGKQAFDPELPVADRNTNLAKYTSLIDRFV
jgi:hypothetical protein